MSRRHPMRTINNSQELPIELAVLHVDMTGNELAGRIEREQDAVDDHRVDQIDGILAGMLVYDAITQLHIIRGFLNVGQSPEELVLAIGHRPAEPFENSLGIALAGIAGQSPEILDGTAGRHNERDLALAVFDSRHDPADVLPLGALQVANDDALAHEFMSADLPDARVGLDGHLDVRADVLETAARMRQETLGINRSEEHTSELQ